MASSVNNRKPSSEIKLTFYSPEINYIFESAEYGVDKFQITLAVLYLYCLIISIIVLLI